MSVDVLRGESEVSLLGFLLFVV
jgi:hypothetical protein